MTRALSFSWIVLFDLFVLILSSWQPLLIAASDENGDQEKIVAVLGSSVAAGWVTSFEERYDMQNGYAGRLARLLRDRGYTVKNVSVPGDDTKNVLERMERDLYPLKPKFVIIGLSLGNEGIEEQDPDTVLTGFKKGIQEIAARCKARRIVPIIGSCYSCNTFREEHYSHIKEMNLYFNTLKLPVINLLGGIDDGHGHIPEGYCYDDGHPDNRGHEEMFHTIVPGLFEALELGGTLPVRPEKTGCFTVERGKGDTPLSFIPDEIIHSFAMVLTVRTATPGTIGSIRTRTGGAHLEIDKEGGIQYQSADGKTIRTSERTADLKWHDIALSHRYLQGETVLFVDGRCAGRLNERMEPVHFVLGGETATRPDTTDFRDWMIFRSSLNPDEIEALHEGRLLHASLEVYAPLNDSSFMENNRVTNLALSTSEVYSFPADPGQALKTILKKSEAADLARQQEPVVEEKQPIRLDPAIYDDYAGLYQLAPGVNLEITREEDRLYLIDPEENKAELFPESETKFFIKFPLAELTVTFVKDKKSAVTHLVFSMNGEEEKAVKNSP
ncbi:MAG: DUF3471 domain-containing protein [Planctomycetes bacterium]|nr:DUF3471 domain-containing protein [Planctomycetota bacterium]